MKLEPKICGKWDGCGLWLQWNQAEDKAAIFELQIHYRRNAQSDWGPWIATVPPQGPRSYWGVIPTWKEGWLAQARVRVAGIEAAWEDATEVTFTRCWALFEISSAKYDQHFVPGSIFHAQVDAAACAYQSKEEIFVKAGEIIQTRLYAMGSSGYFQLDQEDDFDVRPTFGVRVRNLKASVEDIVETGRDFTVIEPKKPDPVTMTVTPAGRF
jgi:hypothetical protein